MPHPILPFLLPASDRTYRVSEPQERGSLFADSVDIHMPATEMPSEPIVTTYRTKKETRPQFLDLFEMTPLSIVRFNGGDKATLRRGLRGRLSRRSPWNADPNIIKEGGRMYRTPCLYQVSVSSASSVETISFLIIKEEIRAGEKRNGVTIKERLTP